MKRMRPIVCILEDNYYKEYRTKKTPGYLF
jgi:hypothetical protein